MNYAEPDRLHDYRYLGQDKREREKLRRRIQTMVRDLHRRPKKARRVAAVLGDGIQRRSTDGGISVATRKLITHQTLRRIGIAGGVICEGTPLRLGIKVA